MFYQYPDPLKGMKLQGFTLMEVMVGVFLSTLLMTGITQLMSGSVAAYRLQLEQSQLEESSRYARDVLMSHISQAGFQPEPWLQDQNLSALTDESSNGSGEEADQLGLQRMSQHNCYGNENPVKDADGISEFFLLQTRFSINSTNNLAMTCRYGPDKSSLVVQIRNYGVVENVESMQLLYAEDLDGDAVADHWVNAQSWNNENRVLALKVALLFYSDMPFRHKAALPITLLDESVDPPTDGKLRRVSHMTTAIRGRLR